MGWWEVGWERGTKQPSHLCVLNPQRLHSVRLESADEVSIRLYSSLCCSKPSLSFLRHKLIKLPSSSTCSCCTCRWGLVSGKLPMQEASICPYHCLSCWRCHWLLTMHIQQGYRPEEATLGPKDVKLERRMDESGAKGGVGERVQGKTGWRTAMHTFRPIMLFDSSSPAETKSWQQKVTEQIIQSFSGLFV